MNKAATTKMVAAILSACRSVAEKLLAPQVERIDALQEELKALPAARDGKDGQDGLRGSSGEQGPQGERGEKGEAGENGKDGEQGSPGERGIQGAVGERGEVGEKGTDGAEGRDGRDGIQGDPGRDALQIEVLPAIDETRSYPRGTFASFRGGLVRSLRNTDALQGNDLARSGWSVLVQGIASESEEFSDDGRTEKRVTTYTDGSKFERTVTRSFLLDRGVFKDDAAYAKGDGVTFGGSFWIAQKDAPQGNPGSTPDFRLAVKKGRDAETVVRNTRAAPATVKIPS